MGEIFRIWLSGGWVMIPLFVLALLLYAQAFQLMMYVRRNDFGGSELSWWEWVRSPDKAEGQAGEIIRYARAGTVSDEQIRNRFDEIRAGLIHVIDRRTAFLGTLVAAAPLLGLLGTVIGMLQTFLGISTSGGAETAGAVASGISEALVTTQTGLTIALPGLFLVMMIRRRRHEMEAHIARLESLTLSSVNIE